MGMASTLATQLQSSTPQTSNSVIAPPPTPFVQTQPLADARQSWQSGKGKGQGSQGKITYPGQGGQPAMGQPNPYPNTISSWDNPPTGMSTQPAVSGKSKGA